MFFPSDRLGAPDEDQNTMIWAFLYTGMFTKNQVSAAKQVTQGIAHTIRNAFEGVYGVEVFVRSCDSSTKTLLNPTKSD